MSYVAYEDITSPNEVVEHIAEYVKSKGYTVVQDYADDNDIYGGSITDGKKLVFKDKTDNYYINLRSCNGYQIFGSGDENYQDTLDAKNFKDKELRGVGMTVSEGYSSSTRWYNQYRVPNKFKTQELLGTYMPVPLFDEGAIAEVAEPTPVPRPEEVAEPTIPSYPPRPVAPTMPNPVVAIMSLNQSAADIKRGKLINGYVPTSEMRMATYLLEDTVYKGGFSISFRFVANVNHRIDNQLFLLDFPSLNIDNTKLALDGSNIYLADANHLEDIGALTVDERFNLIYAVLLKLKSNQGEFVVSVPISNTRSEYRAVSAVPGALDQYFYISHPFGGLSPVADKNFNKTLNYIDYYPDGYNPNLSPDVQTRLRLPIVAVSEDGYLTKFADTVKKEEKYIDLKAQYDADIVAYNNEVKQINDQYAQDIQAYDAYLQELARYNSYLEQLNLYNNYLSKLDEIKYKYTLFCNEVKNDGGTESTLIFSLMKSKGDWFQVSHLVVGNIDKYDVWTGGIFFSGSANRYNMKVANKLYSNSAKTLDSNIYPILSSGKDTNTFLRIDIDNAPSDSRGNIRWASSGEDNITGKKLSLTIRTGNGTIPYGNGEIPHFYYLQSHSRLDSGRNVNTLNCITLNLPIFMAVSVDPDDLQNYAAVGEVRGVYFISMFNLQTSSVYTINRPDSTESCQGFSVGRRRGHYGFDGISILQQDD